MERQYQPQPITVPRRLEASSGRQLKQIVDNRPEFAAQAKVLGQLGVVQRWCPITALHKQTGGNCGLFCIRMAIESIPGGGPKPAPADYDTAAEANGSHVGEIFDITTMENIIKSPVLGTYKAKTDDFSNANELETKLGPAATHPTLIGFSNHEYLSARGKTDINPTTTAGQRGHWSLIHNVDLTKHELGIINPNNPSVLETISSNDMDAASQAIRDKTGSKGLSFDWKTFVKGFSTTSGKTTIGTATTKDTNSVNTLKKYTSTINGGDVDVTNNKSHTTKKIAGGTQKIDIGGRLVTIEP